MKNAFILVLALVALPFVAHAQFAGRYKGAFNGDNVSLVLQNDGNNRLSGKMQDSQQTYDVKAQVSGDKLVGTAEEKSLSLNFKIEATLLGNALPMTLTLEVMGQKQVMDIKFFREGTPQPTVSQAQTQKTKPKTERPAFPANATQDPKIVGAWKQSDNYSSGSGSSAFSATNEQKIIFFADGTLADGGGFTGISGADYSGSSASAAKATPGVYWYTIGNQIYLMAVQNGQTEVAHLGRYYVENGAMLITGTNGKKLLLTR